MEGLGSRGPQLPSAQVDLVVPGQAVGPRFLCKIQEQLYMDNHRGYFFGEIQGFNRALFDIF